MTSNHTFGKVALCVSGEVSYNQFQSDVTRGAVEPIELLDKFVRQPLDAEIYLFVSQASRSSLSKGLLDFLRTSPHLGAVVGDRFSDKNLPEFAAELSRRHGGRRIRLPASRSGQKFLVRLAQWERCLSAVQTMEESDDWKYSYVGFTRLDLIWMAMHPPLSVLESARCSPNADIWALDGEEYGGVNDRYFLATRSSAIVLGTLIWQLTSLRHIGLMKRSLKKKGIADQWPTSAERLILHAIVTAGLCLQRMPAIAALVASEWSSGKYPYEFEAAERFAQIWHDGGWWEKTPTVPYLRGARCQGVTPECCKGASLGGNTSCWPELQPGTYSLRRCCLKDYVAVVLHPHPRTVLRWGASCKTQIGTPQVFSLDDESDHVDSRAWQCIPFSMAEVENEFVWKRGEPNVIRAVSKYSSTPLGAFQCYDVEHLVRNVDGEHSKTIRNASACMF